MWLISEVGEVGKVKQCDARCYNARGHKCECLCKGANHGQGLERAIGWVWENVVDLVREQERGNLVLNVMFGRDLYKGVCADGVESGVGSLVDGGVQEDSGGSGAEA